MPRTPYPHMMPRDIPIWERWLELHGSEFTRFLYDIRVGDGAPMPDDIDPQWAEVWSDLTKKRIDVIAQDATTDLIIEVKDIISFTAIGQILAYPVLYEMTHHPTAKIAILLVAGGMLADLEPVLQSYGIPFEIV